MVVAASMFQLDARHAELIEALDFLELSTGSKYHSSSEGVEVPEQNDKDELRPYRPLDPDRIKISGRGGWDCSEFLSDLLYMPFVEPFVNTYDVVPPDGSYPEVSEDDRADGRKLYDVWDRQSLLTLIPAALGPGSDQRYLHTRVFGNYKDKCTDRQIGDRRGANFT